jgi:hypothetical protein
MKRLFIFALFLFFAGSFSFAQEIDRSQYQEIDFFDYKVAVRHLDYSSEPVRHKIVAYFNDQSGTGVHFKGATEADGTLVLTTNRRWSSLNRGQQVTIYVTSSGRWVYPRLDDIDIAVSSSVSSQTKPWASFIAPANRTGLRGWYLIDLGNGAYQERFFE